MAEQYTLALPLSPDATFANYIGEASAKLAHLESWNVIWGKPGSGRSHLLQALCRDDAEQIKSDYIYLAALNKLDPEVLRNLEMYTVVCLDDVDDVFGEKAWEEALFHLLNSCKDLGTQVVLSVQEPIANHNIGLLDLKSRLSSALAIETDQPGDAENPGGSPRGDAGAPGNDR